jgi:pentatricopeptide repeat protein
VEKKFAPDEGLILLVLHVAGRFGDPDLAASAIAELGPLSIQPQEHHLAPLLEAFCVRGMLTDAMEVLDVMRTTAGIDPNLHTAAPIVKIIGQDTGLFDGAYFALETLKSSGKRVDVSAFNAVIAAAEKLGDLGRAVAVYQQAEKLGVRPNTETYNSLLGACIAKKAKPQGDLLIKEMQSPKKLPGDQQDPVPIPMDLTTYTKLIRLALSQPSYEEAFFYLEKMKDANYRPPLEVYEALVNKCVSSGDQRFKLVLEEMRAGGYRPSKRLYDNIQRYLEGRPARGGEDDAKTGRGRGGRGRRSDQ